MKLNTHARIEIALATALLLGSCGNNPKAEFTDAQRDEIRDIAGDVGADPDEVANLFRRVAAIEAKLGM